MTFKRWLARIRLGLAMWLVDYVPQRWAPYVVGFGLWSFPRRRCALSRECLLDDGHKGDCDEEPYT